MNLNVSQAKKKLENIEQNMSHLFLDGRLTLAETQKISDAIKGAYRRLNSKTKK